MINIITKITTLSLQRSNPLIIWLSKILALRTIPTLRWGVHRTRTTRQTRNQRVNAVLFTVLSTTTIYRLPLQNPRLLILLRVIHDAQLPQVRVQNLTKRRWTCSVIQSNKEAYTRLLTSTNISRRRKRSTDRTGSKPETMTTAGTICNQTIALGVTATFLKVPYFSHVWISCP